MDVLAQLGTRHILMDFDGTIVEKRRPTTASIGQSALTHLRHLASAADIMSLSIVTANISPVLFEVATSIGPDVRLFQAIALGDTTVHKGSPDYYRHVLAEVGASETPGHAVMVGDSPLYDILPAQAIGMRTILVDRLEVAEG